MANLIDIQDLLSAGVEVMAKDVSTKSLFMGITKNTDLGLGGKTLVRISGGGAGMVSQRGGKKPAFVPVTNAVQMQPVEIASITVFTDQLESAGSSANVAAQLHSDAVANISKAYDHMVRTGVDIRTGDAVPVGFGNFGGLTPATVNTAGELSALIIGLGETDHVVISTALMADLISRENQFGTPVFKFQTTGTNTGTINSIPYTTFRSPDKIAYAGAFQTDARAGVVGKLKVDIVNTGIVTDINSNEHNLFEENKLALRVSGLFGYAVTDFDSFGSFTSGEAGDGEEG